MFRCDSYKNMSVGEIPQETHHCWREIETLQALILLSPLKPLLLHRAFALVSVSTSF